MTNTEMVEAVCRLIRSLGFVAGEARFALKYDGSEGPNFLKPNHARLLNYAEDAISGAGWLRDELSLKDYMRAHVAEDSRYWRLTMPLLGLCDGLAALSLAVKIFLIDFPGREKAGFDQMATMKHRIEWLRQRLDELERELDNG